MNFEKIKKILRQIADGAEDLFFPQEAKIVQIEKMTSAELIARTKRPIESPASFIHPLFDYKDPIVRTIVWQIKYKGNKRIVRLIGKILSEEILAYCAENALIQNFCLPIIIPIPISPKRRRKRGFNQCELLALALLSHLDIKDFGYLKDVLIKNKNTLPQTKTRSREKRLKNLRGCFSVKNPAAILGKNIILIDDVATTGSTVEEAAKTLRRAGARRVIAFTIAH